MNLDIPVPKPPLTISAVKTQDILISLSMLLKQNMIVDGGTITGLQDPITPTEPATKNYVDNLINNEKWKGSVRAATTVNITLSGAQTIDGVNIVADDRVLVKSQTDGVENGIYVASASAWTRSVDMAAGTEAAGVSMWVSEGTINADVSYVCTNDKGTDIVGTDILTFIQFINTGTVTAGDGLTLTVNTLSVNVDDVGIEINADTLRVKDVGITNAKLANPSLTITAGVGLSGGGAVSLGGTVSLDVNVDNVGIEIVADTLRVKDLGITNAKLTNSSITVTAGDGLSGGGTISLGGTGNLDLDVDGTTIEIAADVLQLIDTAVTPGSYTNTNLTVDAQGRLTAASSPTVISVPLVFGFRDIFSTNPRFACWALKPTNFDTLANTLLVGKAGTITSVSFNYIDGPAISIGIGESAVFDIGTISGGTGTDPVGTFVALAGGSSVVTWDNSYDGTWPSESASVSIAITTTTLLAVRCIQTGTVTQNNAEVNGSIWLELS